MDIKLHVIQVETEDQRQLTKSLTRLATASTVFVHEATKALKQFEAERPKGALVFHAGAPVSKT
jgi:hypothetical protein